MMSELKMSDYFDKPVEFVGDTIECPDFAYATTTCEWEVNGVDYGHAIAHAINQHDSLVEENQRIAAIATKHATRADELHVALDGLLDLVESCNGLEGVAGTRYTFNPNDMVQVTEAREVLDRAKTNHKQL